MAESDQTLVEITKSLARKGCNFENLTELPYGMHLITETNSIALIVGRKNNKRNYLYETTLAVLTMLSENTTITFKVK